MIEGAAADVSIYLPPSAHFEMGSRIHCGSNIRVTVASSGEGATLDGKGETGLFSLSGRCSLTLRGLTLVNGKADWSGGVVEAWTAGDIEIIDSTVTGCSANQVRRVELAAERCRRTCLPHPRSASNSRSAASSMRIRAVRSR